MQGLGELSLRDTTTYSMDPHNAQFDFKRFGSKPVQDLARAGLTDIPELKWQYLVTIHIVLGAGNTWWEVEGATLVGLPTAKSLHDRGVTFIDVSGETDRNAGHIPDAVHLSWERTANPRFSKTTLLEVVQFNDEIVFYDSGPLMSPA